MSVIYIGNFLGNKIGFYSGPNQFIVDSLLKEGINIKYASNKVNKFKRFAEFCKLIITERKNAKIAFIDTYSTQAFYFSFFVSFLCIILNIKYVLVLHGGNLPERFHKSSKLIKWIFQNAFEIISPSKFLQQKAIDSKLRIPLVIPNPIELARYKFKQREKIGPRLLWVRSLQSIYNPTMALEVVQKLKVKYPTIYLTMVGPDKGNLLTKLKEEIVAKQIKNNVKFTDKLTLVEWMTLSEDSDIFINTTHIDNTPVSVLEAMMLGLPIVSTNVGGIPFVIGDKINGLLCNDNNVEEMCRLIDLLISDPQLVKRLTLNARRFVDENYSSEKVLKAWIKLINTV